MQWFLVGMQAAVIMVLLVGAALLVRSLSAVQAIELGYDVAGLHVVELDLELAGYDSAAAWPVYERLVEEVRAIPGVSAAATSRWAPLRGPSVVPVRDVAAGSSTDAIRVTFDRVSTDFFETAGVALLAGRAFTVADGADGRLVAVVNRALADRFWPGESAVGKRLRADGAGRGEFEVVGVAADARYGTLFGPVPMKLYVRAAQRPHHAAALLVRAADVGTIAPAVRAAIAEIDPDVPIIELRSADSYLADFLTGRRIAAWVASVVGLAGLVLCAVGVYGVTAFVAARRRHEIGVRLALGATSGDVVAMMMASGMRAPLIGMSIGTVIALAAARALGALLYGVGALDPRTYAIVASVVFTTAAMAILVRSRRAAALDPIETLRAH
jgi:predicted permease